MCCSFFQCSCFTYRINALANRTINIILCFLFDKIISIFFCRETILLQSLPALNCQKGPSQPLCPWASTGTPLYRLLCRPGTMSILRQTFFWKPNPANLFREISCHSGNGHSVQPSVSIIPINHLASGNYDPSKLCRSINLSFNRSLCRRPWQG